ncbi:nuclear transport factor 2 family protein [Altererythrobacter sp. Root672]|uniref:nuclear transport factor 2 family protein n=1 Tax=Altererythrobacter sp. Root672 TaxID=1736584 RepID=UPI00138F6251|nr:nuclear transport factor 2 family protein [Altererythrobacter sp. Root672]
MPEIVAGAIWYDRRTSNRSKPMSDDLSNAARVAAAYRQWEESLGADPEPFMALAAENVEMASVLDPPDLDELATDHHGLSRMREYFAAIEQDWEMIDYPNERVVEQGDTVVWIGRCCWRNRHTGLVINSPKVDIWTFRNGKAVRFLELFDTLGFARAAGLLPQLAARFA